MSSSPLRTHADQQLKESPSRFQSRFNERFKSVMESPAREDTATITLKSSPLRPSQPAEHKVFDGEKYTIFEIPNEDRGGWRERAIKEEKEQQQQPQQQNRSQQKPQPQRPQQQQQQQQQQQSPPPPQQQLSLPLQAQRPIASSARPESPSPKPTHERKPPVQSEAGSSKSHRIPHYMQSTQSFHDKVNARKEGRRTGDVLRARTKGGITKKTGTSKIPRYISTTSINAVEDIQSEMAPDDVYVPLAARIKMFERGLGNGSNKAAPVTAKYSRSNSLRSNSPMGSSNSSKQSSPSMSHRRIHHEESGDLPSYLRPTSSSVIKQRHHSPTSLSPTLSSLSLQKKPRKEVKPFHFATSERAEHYKASFKEKLNLWKGKDRQAAENNNLSRGIKRKNVTTEDPHRHQNKLQRTNK